MVRTPQQKRTRRATGACCACARGRGMSLKVPSMQQNTTRTVHISRTMMLTEAITLFQAVPKRADLNTCRQAIVEDNLLLKRTVSNREKTFRFLRELYALDPDDTVYGALRTLWDGDPLARPILALLNAAYRDEVLRPSAAAILAARPGAVVTKQELAATIDVAYPKRFGEKSLDKVSRNVASTWTQSGHLTGRVAKKRAQVKPTVGAAAFALLLGWLEGQRGLSLFETLWAKVIGDNGADLDTLAFAASNRDWLRFKRLGDVVEIDFTAFLAGLEVPRG